MIDFTTTQLSWLIIGTISIGGTGYINLSAKVDDVDKKLAVAVNTSDSLNRSMERLEKQLNRIEEKIDRPAFKR